ncbi:hypothetical protein JDF658_26660, partial [Carboxydocella sp. JDF658]
MIDKANLVNYNNKRIHIRGICNNLKYGLSSMIKFSLRQII